MIVNKFFFEECTDVKSRCKRCVIRICGMVIILRNENRNKIAKIENVQMVSTVNKHIRGFEMRKNNKKCSPNI